MLAWIDSDIILHFLAPPSAPYDISLLSCDGHSMLLTWKKPLLSGGSNIKEYYVDKRRSGTAVWREVHIPPISERVYKVHTTLYLLFDFACLTKPNRDYLVWRPRNSTEPDENHHSVRQVEGLTEGANYQFQVYAANLAGLGPASKHSDDFTCEGWTMPEPG